MMQWTLALVQLMMMVQRGTVKLCSGPLGLVDSRSLVDPFLTFSLSFPDLMDLGAHR